MTRRVTMKDIYDVAAALDESVVIQEGKQPPEVGDAGLILTKNSTDTRWFQALLVASTAVCFLRGRIVFPLQGASLLYYGADFESFRRHCSPFGSVWTPGPTRETSL